MKFRHISKSNTQCCVLHVATITLFWLVTFIHTYTYPSMHACAQTHTHTHTYTHTHTHTHTHTDLNFAIVSKDHQIKYTSNWDNAGLQKFNTWKFKLFNENIRPMKTSG